MRKKIGAFIMAASFLVVSLTGCVKESSSSKEPAESVTKESATEEDTPDVGVAGGFDFTEAVGAVAAEEKAIFEKAIAEHEGTVLEPLAVISKQVVAGTNYSFLCKSTPVTNNAIPEIKIVVITSESDGNAAIHGFGSFDVGKILYNQVEVGDEALDGGWSICEAQTEVTLPDNVKAAFDKACIEYTGVNLVPQAYLGSQVVAGSNYLLLCHTETVAAEPVHGAALVKVYEDIDGNASIEEVCGISSTPEIE